MAPDGRTEIGYKITSICSAVNTLPAPAASHTACPCSASCTHCPAHTPCPAQHFCLVPLQMWLWGHPSPGPAPSRGSVGPHCCSLHAHPRSGGFWLFPCPIPNPRALSWGCPIPQIPAGVSLHLQLGAQGVPLSRWGAPHHPISLYCPLAVLHH